MKRILVADDQEEILSVLQEVLEGEGYIVDVVPSLQQVLYFLEHNHYDVAVLDVVYEKEGILDVWGLPYKYPEIHFVIITAYMRSFEQAPPTAPNVRVLRKPFSVAQLLTAIEGNGHA